MILQINDSVWFFSADDRAIVILQSLDLSRSTDHWFYALIYILKFFIKISAAHTKTIWMDKQHLMPEGKFLDFGVNCPFKSALWGLKTCHGCLLFNVLPLDVAYFAATTTCVCLWLYSQVFLPPAFWRVHHLPLVGRPTGPYTFVNSGCEVLTRAVVWGKFVMRVSLLNAKRA